MSAVQPNQLSSFSPTLLSPTSTTLTNHISHFDNSDQGSVDSDYTSLGSSKFYGNSGSSSSLHRQGRSHSIDELASTPGTTTTIPTRHFNGNLNAHKSNADPLQFVKVHPNHDLIERAQEQLSLAGSRKRLQDNYKLTSRPSEPKANDDEVDWSKAVENWRQKRELKRLKSANGDNERPLSPIHVESPPKAQESRKQRVNEPAPKPPRAASSPPIEKNKSKSPSPVRIKGPAKVREVSLDKPVEMRGFGFKLDGGRAHNRPIFISTIEEGSPADKAGLGIDDEILAINNESVENTTFDQVRRILKERNIRGSIKLLVRTYEDLIDDNSQTVSTGFATDHSRTPSPQKHVPPATKPSSTPSPTSNTLSPVYTFLPYHPPAAEPLQNSTVQQPLTSSTALNILAPKPFRSTASISLDVPNHQEPDLTFSRKELLTLMSIYDKELQDLEAEFEKQLRGIDETSSQEAAITTTSANEKQPTYPTQFPPPRILMNTSQIATERPPPLEPISSVNIFVQSVAKADTNGKPAQQRNDSPITQVRSYVEKQMDQLQQDLEFGFSRTPKVPPPPPPTLLSTTPIGNLTNTLAPEQQQRPVSIPIDLSHAQLPPTHDFQRSSLKKSLSTQNELDQGSHNRTYGLKVNPKEQMIQYIDPYSPPKPSINYVKRSIPDLPSMTTVNRPSTAHSIERTVNELRIDVPSSYSSQPHVINQQQKKVTIQLGDQSHPQRISSKHLHTTLNQAPRKTQVEDNSWIHHDHRSVANGVSNGRRSAPNTPHQPEAPISRPPPPPADYDYHPRNGYQRNVDLSPAKQPRTKPIGRTMSNDRVLSVSGKLRCSRCQDELGHGSAMVIESLGLYYHIECFRCFVCNAPLSSSPGGIDVRVRSNRLHCQNCFSDENGVKLSAV